MSKTTTTKKTANKKTKGNAPAKAKRGSTKGIAAADQENARLRDERDSSSDAMTAAERAMTKSAKEKKISALDAAAQVLAEAGEPLNAKQMIDAMAAKGLWTSPGGKTPHSTLYAAIITEIAKKGDESRFKKTERGRFTRS